MYDKTPTWNESMSVNEGNAGVTNENEGLIIDQVEYEEDGDDRQESESACVCRNHVVMGYRGCAPLCSRGERKL